VQYRQVQKFNLGLGMPKQILLFPQVQPHKPLAVQFSQLNPHVIILVILNTSKKQQK
jgi:hypothetical protein